MDNFDNKTQNICRMCLVENHEDTQSVFDTIDSTGELQQFSEILMTFAKVEIISGDKLSDQICFTCAEKTIEVYLFKIQCEESDKTLRNRFKEDSFKVIDKININEEDIFDKIHSDMKEENVEVSGVLKKSDGDGYCVQRNENNQKFDSQRPEMNNDKNTINGVPMKSLVIILEDCNEMSTLKNSMKTRIGKKKSFKESKNIRQHSVRHDITTSTSLAIKGKLIGSERNTFECDVCNKKLSSSSTFRDHQRIHTGEKPYECDVCKQRFKVQCHLIVHKRIHTGEKPYQCNICKLRYNQSSTLMVHKRLHTGEKPYECDVCKQRFAVSTHLSVHKRTHTGERPYECNVCKQRFIHSSNLVVHKRKHTGETPYECDICKQRFTQSGGLVNHKRLHTGEKPFECNVCEQRFTQASSLVVHKRTHTGEKPYECDVCKQRFKQSSALITHKRRIHKYRQKNK